MVEDENEVENTGRPQVDEQSGAEKIADRVHSAAIHLLRALKARDRSLSLSGARLSALSVLYFAGPMTMSQLASAEDVKLPTMSRLVKEMVFQQLVTRTSSETDGRTQMIDMTPKGRTLFMRARVNRLMALTTVLEEMPDEDQETLLKAADLIEFTAKAIKNA